MRFFSSKLVSATSSSSLLELWCSSILCPPIGGLKSTVILPHALADGWGPRWALRVLLSPSPSGHTGRAPMQPRASRGWANAGARLWSMGLVWPDKDQSCDLPLSGGLPRGGKWDVMVEFLQLRCHFQKNVQVSSWISICICTVGKAAGASSPWKLLGEVLPSRRGSARSLLCTPKLCWPRTQFRCLWRFLSEGWKLASVLPVQVLSQIWTKSL